MNPIPCPWCGQLPFTGRDDPGAPYDGYVFIVECRDEACSVSPGVLKKGRVKDEEVIMNELITQWNSRVDL